MSEFDDLLKKRAVALKYDPEKNGAPVVVASCMGYMACLLYTSRCVYETGPQFIFVLFR